MTYTLPLNYQNIHYSHENYLTANQIIHILDSIQRSTSISEKAFFSLFNEYELYKKNPWLAKITKIEQNSPADFYYTLVNHALEFSAMSGYISHTETTDKIKKIFKYTTYSLFIITLLQLGGYIGAQEARPNTPKEDLNTYREYSESCKKLSDELSIDIEKVKVNFADLNRPDRASLKKATSQLVYPIKNNEKSNILLNNIKLFNRKSINEIPEPDQKEYTVHQEEPQKSFISIRRIDKDKDSGWLATILDESNDNRIKMKAIKSINKYEISKGKKVLVNLIKTIYTYPDGSEVVAEINIIYVHTIDGLTPNQPSLF